jgi:hypothetical protein
LTARHSAHRSRRDGRPRARPSSARAAPQGHHPSALAVEHSAPPHPRGQLGAEGAFGAVHSASARRQRLASLRTTYREETAMRRRRPAPTAGGPSVAETRRDLAESGMRVNIRHIAAARPGAAESLDMKSR